MKSSSSLTSNVNGRLPSAEPMNPTPHASNAMSLATAAPAIASRTSSVASSPQRAAPKTKHSSSRRASADDASAGANKDFAATLRRLEFEASCLRAALLQRSKQAAKHKGTPGGKRRAWQAKPSKKDGAIGPLLPSTVSHTGPSGQSCHERGDAQPASVPV
eukprot:Tamp_29607.p1 GENE.Tamp_29607~~Tamp_29607.p1  ORF type:complete len:172 (+),score=20.20 Tamp_29607:36-518(+)